MTFDHKSVEATCVTLLKDHFVRLSPMKIQSIWIQWPFSKTWTQGHWPLDDLWPTPVEVTRVTLPKDHCVQVPWEYINVCGYSDQFCKIPHTTYIHTTYVQNEWSHSLFLNGSGETKNDSLHVPATTFLGYRSSGRVSLFNYTLKITIFVCEIWGNFVENWYFVNNFKNVRI